MTSKIATRLVRNNPTSYYGRNSHSCWLVSLFVGLLCTGVANQAALANDASLTPIASITKAMTNHDVTVQATISGVHEPSSARAPYNVSLTEGGTTLPLIYWSDMQPQVAPKVKVGNVVHVTALVNVYRDTLQLRLRSPASLTVVSEAPGGATPAPATPGATPSAPAPVVATPATAAPAVTVIGAIKPDWADRVVIVSGTIAISESVDKTQRLSVQDATGEIQAVLSEKVLSGVPATELQPGHVVTITGPVKFDNGTRQIVPDTAGDVKFGP
jgi:DNA/RNA endonuclease YhcR with UshA esterase domain